ncbi:putative integral membrane protein [Brugia pahangi]
MFKTTKSSSFEAMQSLYSDSDVEANKANALLVGTNSPNPTWFHFVVSIHAISALSLCVFTVLGYVASTIPMTLVVLFIFQTFMAILGLAAIEQSRRDYRSLYIAVNIVTAGSAIIWSIFLFIKMKEYPIYVPVVFLIIALFSLPATILLIFFPDKRIPQSFEKVICLDLFPFAKLFCDTRMSKKANTKSKSIFMHMLTASTSFFGGKKFDDTRPKGKREVNAAQSVGVKEENSVQLIETKEVNSNESLNGSIKSVGDQQKDSSIMKVSASMTESVQQQQNITETRNEEFPKRSRIAAGAERDVKEGIKPVVQLEEISNETKNSAVSSYVNHPSEGHCLVIGSNWREFYAIPILNACNVPLCSTARTGRDRFCNRLLIKKCRNKKKKRKIIPKFSPLEKNIFEHSPQNNAKSKL